MLCMYEKFDPSVSDYEGRVVTAVPVVETDRNHWAGDKLLVGEGVSWN